MGIKFTKGTLKKLEQLFEELRYKVRYEKGQFHSGYCILEDRKIAIINKFLDAEGRINAFLDILPHVKIPYNKLSTEIQRFYDEVLAPYFAEEAEKHQLQLVFEDNDATV